MSPCRRLEAFVVRRSPFVVRRSSFVVRRCALSSLSLLLSLLRRRPSVVVRSSSVVVRRSSSVVRRPFVVRSSSIDNSSVTAERSPIESELNTFLESTKPFRRCCCWSSIGIVVPSPSFSLFSRYHNVLLLHRQQQSATDACMGNVDRCISLSLDITSTYQFIYLTLMCAQDELSLLKAESLLNSYTRALA